MHARLDVLTRDVDAEVSTVRALLERASMLPTLYAKAADPRDRKALLSEIFARVVVRDRTIVGTEYKPPFRQLLGDSAERPGSECGSAAALLDRVASNSA